MNKKEKLLWCLIGMFIFSLILNMFLIKYRIEVNFIEGWGNSQAPVEKVSSTKKSSRSIFSRAAKPSSKFSGYSYNFEDGRISGWKGKVTNKIVPPKSKYALEARQGGNKYFAASTAIEYGAPNRFKVDTDTKVEFDYYIEEGSVLRVQMYCPPRRDNFYFDIKNPTLGQWDKFVLDFASFSDNAHTGRSPKRGDLISNLQIYAGRAGEGTLLVVDNIEITGTH